MLTAKPPLLAKMPKGAQSSTNKIHENYIGCYIKKEKPLGEYPKKFRSHMFKLHETWLWALM